MHLPAEIVKQALEAVKEADKAVIAAAKKSLDKAKIQLMSTPDSAFFTTVCLSLKHQFVITPQIPTAATDGKNIYFNPYFFQSLTPGGQLFLLLHETMHVCYMHMTRGMHFPNQEKYNHAADYVINLQLVDRGFEMPECGLLDRKYKGLSAEDVNKLLPDPPQFPQGSPGANGQGEGTPRKGKGDFGSDLIDPMDGAGDAATLKEVESEISDILIRAQVQSKIAGDKPGTIPGEIELYINSLLNPKLPWHHILRKYMNVFNKTDFSFRKPNRRFYPDFILPSAWGEALGDGAIFMDMSGSVSDEDARQMATETYQVLRRLKPKRLWLGQFDTNIKSVDEIHNAEDLMKVRFHGRGGTKIGPALQWAKDNKPQFMVIFTDGYFNKTSIDPRIPIIWIIHGNLKFTWPFGKVIHYEGASKK